MKTSLLLLFFFFAGAALAAESYVRIVDAVQNQTGAIRIEGSGSIVIGTLTFGQATDYILIPVGQQISLQVFNNTDNSRIAGPLTFNLADSNPVRWLTWVITQNATNALLVDNPSVPSNVVFLRVVPLFTAQNLLINSQINGQSVVLVTNNLPALSPGSVDLFVYRPIPAGRATWTITSASPAISATVTFTLEAGKAYTFLVLPGSVIIVLDRSVPIAPITTAVVTTAPVTTQAVTTQAVTTQAVTTQAVTTQAVTTQAVTTQAITTMSQTTGFPVTQTFTDPTVVVITTGTETAKQFIPVIPITGTTTSGTSSLTVAITHFILLLVGYRFGLF